MKSLFLIVFVLIPTMAWSCPNLSGDYVNHSEHLTVFQQGCTVITLIRQNESSTDTKLYYFAKDFEWYGSGIGPSENMALVLTMLPTMDTYSLSGGVLSQNYTYRAPYGDNSRVETITWLPAKP